MRKIILNFLGLMTHLSHAKKPEFSGIGMVLYENLDVLSNYHYNLVDDDQTLPILRLGTQELISYLDKISNYQHPHHDGFHFINAEGLLTHVSQFLSPPINKSIKNINGQGSRTFCSQCSSQIPGVLFIGSISASGKIYLFEKGRLVNEKIIDKEVEHAS